MEYSIYRYPGHIRREIVPSWSKTYMPRMLELISVKTNREKKGGAQLPRTCPDRGHQTNCFGLGPASLAPKKYIRKKDPSRVI
uniref:Uncharacterized protein n=1 Tax=Triticum urartu TaxID=4572 RepID=A0A8R7PRE8_TRIUA